MKGGLNLNEVETKLLSIQEQAKEALDALKETKENLEQSETETTAPELESSEPEPESVSVNKYWTEDKTLKFKDGSGGRVMLSFPRIMALIENNINKGNTKKDWSSIKSKLSNANSVDEVQDVINDYKIAFSSNQVAGTRKRKRGSKRKTHRKY